MRVAIIGSREYPDLPRVRRFVGNLPRDWIVLSGGARGVDREAESAAKGRGMAFEPFLAEWDRVGKGAGFERNERLVRSADLVIAFWDRQSRGTLHAIGCAHRMNKRLRVCDPRGHELSAAEVERALAKSRRTSMKPKPAKDIDYDPAWERDQVSTTRTSMLRRWAKARHRN